MKNPGDTVAAVAIRAKLARKIRSKHQEEQGMWFGLGMMGLIGWSVALPILLGASIGYCIEKNTQNVFPWTLTVLLLGLLLGCCNAWHWVCKESTEMDEAEDRNG